MRKQIEIMFDSQSWITSFSSGAAQLYHLKKSLTEHESQDHSSHMPSCSGLNYTLSLQFSGHFVGASVKPLRHQDVKTRDDAQGDQIVNESFRYNTVLHVLEVVKSFGVWSADWDGRVVSYGENLDVCRDRIGNGNYAGHDPDKDGRHYCQGFSLQIE